jgi:hypothetical protein
MTGRYLGAIAALMIIFPSAALAKTRADQMFVFPADKPVRIVVFRPDVQVGSIGIGGIEEPNAEWTAAARANLEAALKANQQAQQNELTFLPEQEGENAVLFAEYQALLRAVVQAVAAHRLADGKLPAKKDRFDWTLGPGAKRLGEIAGADYALFVHTRDAFATGARKVSNLLGGGLMGLFQSDGIHRGYAALVDLSSGNLVWLNVDSGVGGDPREQEGASERVGQMLSTMPSRKAASAQAR